MLSLWVLLSAIFIIIADALIKKISFQGSFSAALLNPWMLVVCGLYFMQILLAIVVFLNKGELAIYSNLYVLFYCLFGVLVGILVFKEHLSTFQILGVVLAIVASILLNIQ